MDSIFAKAIIFLASILAFISGPDYIKLGADNLAFDFKTGGNYPIYYYLNVQNIGPAIERFEISSDADWVSGRREGTNYNFVELGSQAYINFILEIHPERLPDGVNEAEIILKVFDIESFVSQEVVLDEAEVTVLVNKNSELSQISASPLVETSAPSVSFLPSLTPSSSFSPMASPTPESSPDLSPILKQLQSIIDSLRVLVGRFFQ